MADSRDLLVRIIGDDRSLQNAFTRTERRTKQFETRTQRLGRGLTGAFAAAGVTIGAGVVLNQINDMTQAASDLNEQISRTEVIFGKSADAIIDWSKTTASSIGISQRAALAAAANFGGLFQTVGVSAVEAGELSKSLVRLAADFASLQNTSPEEALIALRSGLAGEAEPLRRYNVFLTEASVQQLAMADSGKKSASALTQQEKTLARYKLILEQSAPAQGNFNATADELANKQRIARAESADLSAELGQTFIPMMEAATDAVTLFVVGLNDGIGAMRRWREELKDFDFPVSGNLPGGDFFGRLAELLRPGFVGGPGTGPPAPAPSPAREDAGTRIHTGAAARAAKAREEELRRANTEAKRSQRRSQKLFDELTKGLGLKLDRAGLTKSLDDDIAVLDELERAIQRQIRREGKTFDLVEQLTRVRLERASLVEQRAEDAKRASQDAFDAIIGALELRFRKAEVTKSLEDDLAALRALEDAIKKRIRAEGETLDLLERLQDVEDRRRALLEQQRERRRERRQERQFRQLGLTAEGEERTPGAEALKKRLASIREAVKGTPLDTTKTGNELDRIARVLSGKFGKVGKDVRAAIKRMLDEIRDALKDEGGGADGQITRGGIKQIDNLVKGLGLTDEQIAAIHERNQRVRRRPRGSAFGFGLDGGGGRTGTTGGRPRDRDRQEIHVHLELDGKEISNVVIRNGQKHGNRRAPARRGRHGGRNVGLG